MPKFQGFTTTPYCYWRFEESTGTRVDEFNNHPFYPFTSSLSSNYPNRSLSSGYYNPTYQDSKFQCLNEYGCQMTSSGCNGYLMTSNSTTTSTTTDPLLPDGLNFKFTFCGFMRFKDIDNIGANTFQLITHHVNVPSHYTNQFTANQFDFGVNTLGDDTINFYLKTHVNWGAELTITSPTYNNDSGIWANNFHFIAFGIDSNNKPWLSITDIYSASLESRTTGLTSVGNWGYDNGTEMYDNSKYRVLRDSVVIDSVTYSAGQDITLSTGYTGDAFSAYGANANFLVYPYGSIVVAEAWDTVNHYMSKFVNLDECMFWRSALTDEQLPFNRLRSKPRTDAHIL